MNVLVIKTSSLGDVLHALPALTDASRARPNVQVDWVVEEALADVPGWHPAVRRTIAVANRRWRRQPVAFMNGEGLGFWRALRHRRYDVVLDAQGLMKSAIIARCAHGTRFGFARESVREPLATWIYQRTVAVLPGQHAVDRMRQLFATSLGYPLPDTPVDYGVERHRLALPPGVPSDGDYLLFLHATTWPSKLWPYTFWLELISLANADGYRVLLPWGNLLERQRAEQLDRHATGAEVLPRLTLTELAALLAHARGAVAVDTGLGHLAAAVATPCVSLYGPSDPRLTGTRGSHQRHLAATFPCAPCLSRRCTYADPATVQPACFTTVPPLRVWSTLQDCIGQSQ